MISPDRPPRLTRRRFVAISAMLAAGANISPARGAGLRPVIWRGRAMGADASITLYHPDPGAAEALLAHCRDAITRLEAQLSLYQPQSALCRLNRNGMLDDAPDTLLEVLNLAADMHRRTGGAFDITVQPLWRLYAGHFARPDADPLGPSPADIAAARALVDARALSIEGHKLSFMRPGMSVTLNGVAQGYVTDQVAHLLRAAGMRHVLLDLGEFRALGPHASGRPWRIGLRDPVAPWRLIHRVALRQGAIATSGGYGTQFDARGQFHHLFDPATGLPARHYRSLSITGPDAARADALSTGLSALPLGRAQAVLNALGPNWGGYFITHDGAAHRYNWPLS